MATERIQKLLAAAGYGSRRSCETLVTDGRVAVNGRYMRELPVLVDPQIDKITVDGKPLRPERHVYFLLNKPRNVYCTHNDPAGRTRVEDLLVGVRERVYPVGRLDAESTGLLIVTNDGALAQKLTHPRFSTPKTYRAEVAGLPSMDTLRKLREGIWLSEGKTSPAEITIIHRDRDKAVLEITLRESRNREIRRMLAKFGHNVRRLMRIRMGKLSIAKLPVGAFRPLTKAEVTYLHSLAEQSEVAVVHSSARPAKFGRQGRRQPERQKRAAGSRGERRGATIASSAGRIAPKRPAGRRIIH